jgi:CheY-like chemotaxis protein
VRGGFFLTSAPTNPYYVIGAVAVGRFVLDAQKPKVLVLASQTKTNNSVAVQALCANCEVVEIPTIEKAMEALRSDYFGAIFADTTDFLPLERALVSQQASLVLNTIGEGVCIVDSEGRTNWSNKKMQAWPARVHETIRRACKESFDLFSKQVSPQHPDTPAFPAFNRSKRHMLNIDDQQFMEMIASPVINPAGQVVQVVAVVWDATGTRRLQQKIDAIDRAGRELVRLEADALAKLNVGERLKLLEEKIISYTRELMHFDHFAIRLLDRGSKKLEMVISSGFPSDALNIDLFAHTEGNGISGYVCATGRSYICPDVERDPRYVLGLDQAKSSLTVPLMMNDRVIGIFNVESRQRAAFNEDDRQFAEIFGRYVAIALNILNLMVTERVATSHTVADTVCGEVAGPLNDIASDANALMDDYIGHEDLRNKLQQIITNVNFIRGSLRQAAEGPNTVLGAGDVKGNQDPVLAGAAILVADDEPNIRNTISDILRKYGAQVTTAPSGVEAIAFLQKREFNLVLSDIKMPDKTGYDVFAFARKKWETVPVILMTGFGYDPNHSIVRASQEGLQAVLFKPFKVQQLLTEVRKALQCQVVKQ